MNVTLLQDKKTEDIVRINEDGVAVEFYVAKHDYEPELNGPGRSLLVRASSAGAMRWDSATRNIALKYSESELDAWFNNDYKNRLDPAVQAAIGTTAFYSSDTAIKNSVVSRAVFTPSISEITGGTVYGSASPYQEVPLEGTKLPIGILLEHIYNCWSRSRLYNKKSDYASAVGTRYNATSSCRQSVVDAMYGTLPCFTLSGSTYVLDDGTIVISSAPTISGADGELGTFSTVAPSVNYIVTDPDGETVTVTIKLDGVVKKTHVVTLGETNTWQLTESDWRKVLNGTHTITIMADDGYVPSVRTYTFKKSLTSMSFTLAEPMPADDRISKALESIIGEIPTGATIKVEVCNNGYDASPTWEDVTQKVLAGNKFQLTNTTKTAAKWGYNVRVTVSRGSAIGDCYITSIGGFFE